MTDQPVPPDQPEAPPSRVVITFGGPGQADMVISSEGTTPGQLMAAAWWLDQWVRTSVQPATAPGPRLVIPRDHLPARRPQ